MKLTPKQKAFADEYLKNGGNATEAARVAGYSCPNDNAKRLTVNDRILNYIAERQAEIDTEHQKESGEGA